MSKQDTITKPVLVADPSNSEELVQQITHLKQQLKELERQSKNYERDAQDY